MAALLKPHSSSSSHLFKLDTLSQGELLGVVDGAGGPSHVLLPGVRSRLASAAGRLLSTESASDLGTGSGDVDVDDAAV